VRETVVVARENLPSDRCLVAYVVPDSDTAPWRMNCAILPKERLLNMPSACGARCLPLTPNGKVDRRLYYSDTSRPELAATYQVCNLMSKKP